MMKKITLSLFLGLMSVIGFAQNNSLNFDGTDDHVELGENFGFEATDSFTIEAWVKTDQLGFMQVVTKLGIEENTFRGWGMQISDFGTISGYVTTEWFAHFRYVEGTAFVSDGAWHHVAMVFDGADTILLYVDGQPDAISDQSVIGTMSTIQTFSTTHIGNYDGNGNPGEYFTGNIDEVRIWDTARTPAEILDNYDNELAGTETNLIGYYKMDVPNSTCDIEDCNSNEAHGERKGANGANNMVQFSDDVPAIDDVACGATIDCQVLGLDENTAAMLSVFPSPASNMVSFSGLDLNGANISIYNVLGSLASTQSVENNSIDVSSLNSGLYFLSFDWEGQTITRKIIKK